MISLGRSSAGRTVAQLTRQQRHVVPKIRPAFGNVDSILGSSRSTRGVYPHAAGRAIVSMTKTPTPLAKGRSIQASKMVPEKLVTMVPWVPPPFQPLMNWLHPIMIAPRRPMKWCGIEALDTTTNYGALCGHISFGLLTLAYIETDVLKLRYLVGMGSTLNIMFNLFRVVGPPVWIPIKWNAFFLALNAMMVVLLAREREEAAQLGQDPEQAKIYDDIFRPHGLSPVNFLRLMDIAERRTVPKGQNIKDGGQPHKEVFLIVEGTAEVNSEGVAVSHMQKGGFVGSMAFCRVQKALSAASHKDDGASYDYHDGGMFRNAWERILEKLRKDGSVVGEVSQTIVGDKKLKRKDTTGFERSHSTVTATSDVVVYVWDQLELREFVKRRPLIGASLMKAITVDLVNKVENVRDHHQHYRILLAEALDGGRVTSTERKNMQRYREGHGISLDEHLDLLQEYGWSREEYEAGFQSGVAKKNFLKYEALLREELGKGKVDLKARSNLRKFRSQSGIDAQEHLIAVEKQGWTADEYEAGAKQNNL